ncbi:MAG: hypothetical protein QGF59_12115, partial [Pirellulaceae bacterium]|nr:hypothetical protein [Pirellulaceae bacterium]
MATSSQSSPSTLKVRHLLSKGRRSIALSPTMVASLRRERARQAERKLRLGAAWAKERGLVFTSAAGTPLDDSALRRAFQKFLAGAGLPRIRFH